MADNEKKKKVKWIIPVVACVLILAIGGGIWYFVSRGEKPSEDSEPNEVTEKTVKLVASSEMTEPEESTETMEPGGKEEEVTQLHADNFTFHQKVFHCGDGEILTRVLAEFYDLDADLSDLVLIAKCEETGEEIMMTDDGEGVDTKAGDHVFYGEASFAFDQEITLTYTLQSQNARYQVSADPATVISYTDETFERCIEFQQEIFQHLDEMAEGVNQDLKTEDDAKALMETVEEIKKYLQALQDEGKIREFCYSFPYFVIDLPVTGCAYQFGRIEGVMDALSGGAAGDSDGSDDKGGFITDKGRGIALLMPYQYQFGAEVFENAAAEVTKASLGYELQWEAYNEKVDATILRNLYPYRVIIFSGHGCWANNEPQLAFSFNYFSLSAEEQASGAFYQLVDEDKVHVLVRNYFFERYYEDDSLNNCLIYLGCCHGAQNDKLQRMLIRKGAKAVLGYDNVLFNDYDKNMIQTFFKNLADRDPNDFGKTKRAEDALVAAKKKHGESDPHYDTLAGMLYCLNHDIDNSRPATLRLLESDDGDSFRLSDENDKGVLKGRVTWDEGRRPIENAKIEIKKDNWKKTLYTLKDGCFGYCLEEGYYQITVTVQGYRQAYYSRWIGANKVVELNVDLEPEILAEDEYEIFLSWYEYAEDLDLHLTGPTIKGNRFEVDYHNNYYLEKDEIVCALYEDANTSDDAETIKVRVLYDDKPYYCFVHHFGGEGMLTNSLAALDVYRGSEHVGIYYVPMTGETGTYWNAFAIKNGKIIINDTITDYPDLNYAD